MNKDSLRGAKTISLRNKQRNKQKDKDAQSFKKRDNY